MDIGHGDKGWNRPRSPIASRHLLETAERHGIPASRSLAGTGLTLDDVYSDTRQVTAEQEMTIARNLIERLKPLNAISVGIEAGQRYHVSDAGILGYAMITSPTIRDLLSVTRRYAELSSAFFDLKVVETPEAMTVEFDNSEVPADVQRFLFARDIAAIIQVSPLLFGSVRDPVIQLEIDVHELRAPIEAALRHADLPMTIRSGSGRNALTFPVHVLDLPLPAADARTAEACRAQCEQLLARHTRRSGIANRVRYRLVQDPAEMPSMSDLAAEFALTERTLHRRLTAEDTSYRALVDEVREALATELLETGLTVDEVARRLGFADTSGFTHAFLRWRGYPPSRHASVVGQQRAT